MADYPTTIPDLNALVVQGMPIENMDTIATETEAIMSTLGTNPQSGAGTVANRFTTVEARFTPRLFNISGPPSGTFTATAGQTLVHAQTLTGMLNVNTAMFFGSMRMRVDRIAAGGGATTVTIHVRTGGTPTGIDGTLNFSKGYFYNIPNGSDLTADLVVNMVLAGVVNVPVKVSLANSDTTNYTVTVSPGWVVINVVQFS